MKKIILLLAVFFVGITIHAEKLPQRTQISLRGTWNFTPENSHTQRIAVPDYWDAHPQWETCKRAVYEREVFVPDNADWQNKIIRIDFEGVNFIADVYVNNKVVGTHIGGWIPFSVDITQYAKHGKSFTLKVDVRGGSYEPIVDKQGNPQWPVGFTGHKEKWGIVFDVWLRAYGQVNVDNAFIQTSYKNKKLQVDYTLKNNSETKRKVIIQSRVIPAIDTQSTALKLNPEIIEMAPGEHHTFKVEKEWSSAHLWSPADPFLYYLQTSVYDAETGNLLDTETRRFGFREVWVESRRLMFNGHPFTILGANIVQHSEFYNTQRYWYMTPETWNQSIDRLFDLNLRTVRFHMQPAPEFIIDIADERGLLVIDESAIYARQYILKSNKPVYLENCKKWIEPWIKARRNHPSIVVWNAENEMGVGWLNWMTPEEIKSLGDAIRLYDTTRPVNYDGDRDVGDQMVNLHYPETYKGTVKGSIYSWVDTLNKEKPTGIGEFITHYGEFGYINQWWMGTWVRGMRYVYFSDIRPYRHDWAWLRSDDTPAINNLRNSLSPVALFDKEYDDAGIDPLLNKNYPLVRAGDTVNHTLVLYNDEFTDTIITIEVLVKSSETYQTLYHYNGDRAPIERIIARGSGTYVVPLGEHIDIPYSFRVPPLNEYIADRIDVELIARKKGEVKFKEILRFSMRERETEFQGEVSPEVLLMNPVSPELE